VLREIESVHGEKDFKKLVIELLKFRGIHIDADTEGVGADHGKDLIGTSFEYDIALGRNEEDSWWIELKYRGNRNLGIDDMEDISSKIIRARNKHIGKFLLITNRKLANTLRDSLAQTAKEHRVPLRIWDSFNLSLIINEYNQKSSEGSIYDISDHIKIADRWNERKKISALIDSGLINVFTFFGERGVGKSVLAKYVAAHFYESKGYGFGSINCKNYAQLGLEIKMLARTLKAQGNESIFTETVRMPINEEDRMEYLLKHILTTKTIIILDNFEELIDSESNFNIRSPQIKNLINNFLDSETNGSVLLITSRISLKTDYMGRIKYEEIKINGWETTFIVDTYLPRLQNINKKLNEMNLDAVEKKALLEPLEGNPYALNMLNQLCKDEKFQIEEVIAHCKTHKESVAQYLLERYAEILTSPQINAINKMSQFSKTLSIDEIKGFICDEETFNELKHRSLIEIAITDNKQKEYSLHQITINQFSLLNDLKARKKAIEELIISVNAKIGKKNINELHPHVLMRQIIEMLIAINEYDRAAMLLIDIGTRIISCGDIIYVKRLIELLNKSDISELNKVKLMKTEAHIESTEAHMHGMYDGLVRAEEIYVNMNRESDVLKDAWCKSAALNGLGSMKRYDGKWDEALDLYTESLNIRQAENMEFEMSNSYHNIGAVHIMKKDYNLAISNLEKAYKIRKKYNDRFRWSASQLYLGEAYASAEEFEKAKKLLNECIQIKSDIKDAVGLVWANIALAKLYILSEDFEQLKIHKIKLRESKKTASLFEPRHIPFLNICLGIIQFIKKDYIEAISLFNKIEPNESQSTKNLYKNSRETLSNMALSALRSYHSDMGDKSKESITIIKETVKSLKA